MEQAEGSAYMNHNHAKGSFLFLLFERDGVFFFALVGRVHGEGREVFSGVSFLWG